MVLVDFVSAREILDSRGYPTTEVTVILSDGTTATASCPAGTSRSSHEAIELRDKEYDRYFGQGVSRAVHNINEIIAPRMKKMNPLEQEKIDKLLLELDGTVNKAHLGANAILPVSIGILKSAAKLIKKPLFEYINELFIKIKSKDRYEEEIILPAELTKPFLPIPLFNLINGGKHANTNLEFQEYLVAPVGVRKVAEQVRCAAEIQHKIAELLSERGIECDVGYEGGFTPNLSSNGEPLELFHEAAEKCAYKPGKEIFFALDCDASYFFIEGRYKLKLENLSGGYQELVQFYAKIIKKFPIFMLEDPFAEEDWESWKTFMKDFGKEGLVAGDDLIATNRKRLLAAIEEEAINSVIVKPNQIGTVTETLDVAKLAKNEGFTLFVSHRSGETNDTFLTDFAVGVGAGYFKAGAPTRGERVAKYNRLMEIAEKIE